MSLLSGVDLAPLNTLALPGRAAYYVRIGTAAELAAASNPSGRRFVLGGGSNLVVTGDFDGLVVHMAIAGRQLLSDDADAWYIAAGAGENWHDFVQWTLAQGWPRTGVARRGNAAGRVRRPPC